MLNSRLSLLILLLSALPMRGEQQKPSPGNAQKTDTRSQPTKSDSQPPANYYQQAAAPHPDNPSWWNADHGTWALVIVGFAGTLAAVCTLRAIQSQVAEMRKTGEQTDKLIAESIKQSEAATKSATALVGAERAWIDGELLPGTESGTVQKVPLKQCEYVLSIKNHGRTPAYIVAWRIGMDALDGQFTRFTPGTLKPMRKEVHLFVPAGHGPEQLAVFDFRDYFAGEWLNVLAGQKTGAVEVAIEYKDLISSDSRETYFAYSYRQSTHRFERLAWMNQYK